MFVSIIILSATSFQFAGWIIICNNSSIRDTCKDVNINLVFSFFSLFSLFFVSVSFDDIGSLLCVNNIMLNCSFVTLIMTILLFIPRCK